jgi:hypothetical protein
MIRRAIATSKKLAQLKTDAARMLYAWQLPFLDAEGRLYASPDIIKGMVVPLLKTVTSLNIKQYLQDMRRVGLIQLYKIDGEDYQQYELFHKYQNIRKDREAPSRIPAPGVRPENSGSSPAKDKLSKGKLREVKVRPEVANATLTRTRTEELAAGLKNIGKHLKE